MTRVGALWIGGLEPYMDENFLNAAMMALGQEGVVSIKVMTNKFTGEPAGYGFINFESDQRAILTMHRLGGKVIPNSNPPVRFKLNHNSTRLQPGEPDTSIWAGDLTPEVDDFALYQFFSQRYQTVRCAKVVLDESGFSKGYGFVRFGSESEQQHALANMTGEHGLGSKPIKVSMANQNRGGGGGIPGGAPGGTPTNGAVRQMSNGGASWQGMRPDGQGDSGSWASQQQQHGGMGGQPHGWPGAGSQGSQPSGQPSATPVAAQPDYNAYHQYYQQYAQQFSQQQQQYAAAYAAWQHQQQQQQTGNPQPQ